MRHDGSEDDHGAGDGDARAHCRERTVRLLQARLEALAVVSERPGSSTGRLERGVVALEAATRHAIALGLVSPAEAAGIWAGVARRHPSVGWCRGACGRLGASEREIPPPERRSVTCRS